jgi:hypothetical protein
VWWVWLVRYTNMSTMSRNGLARRQPAPPPVKDVIPLPVRSSEEKSLPVETKDGHPVLLWHEDGQAADNYRMLGEVLAKNGDLFRRPGYASGLLLLLEDGKHAEITKGAELAPVIVDRVRVEVWKDGKKKGSKIVTVQSPHGTEFALPHVGQTGILG